jgi:ketosteroid isomerase-like protein
MRKEISGSVAAIIGRDVEHRGRNPAILASVSCENVELVRRMYAAYARGEFELGLSCLDPEIEFSEPAGQPGAGIYCGHQGVVQAFANWTGAWDDFRVEVEELSDFGEHVLARTSHHGRGKGSGVEVELRVFQLWTIRHDNVVRTRMYYDEAEALEAVGLRERGSLAGE